MFNLTKKKFNDFPKSNKAMIYLMWIYHFWNLISTLFISIYIFKLESNISNVIIYNIIFFTTVFLWFDWLWYLYSQIKKSVKSIYYIWYTIFILSFTILLLFDPQYYEYIYSEHFIDLLFEHFGVQYTLMN